MKAIDLAVVFLTLVVASRATVLTPNLGEKLFQNKLGIGDGYKSKNVRETVYFQWIDHLNFGAGTFEQRIYINDQFYNFGGPVFIYVSSYGGAETFWLENSYITQIAEEQQGVIYAIEPRFYGNSRPAPDTSLDSLRLLTISQTIADIAGFTRFLRSALADLGSNRFVVFGYDTGATIATFTHQQNPGLFDGVLASGAPMYIHAGFDYYFYHIQLTATDEVNQVCHRILFSWNNELEQLVADGDAARIAELFNLAQEIDLSDPRQVSMLFYISNVIMASNFEWGNHVILDELCQFIIQLVDSGKSNLEAISTYILSGGSEINLDWRYIVEYLRETNWDSDGSRYGERQVWYTACSEWSWFKTSFDVQLGYNGPFLLDFFTQFCFDVFGLTHQQVVDGNWQTSNVLQLNPGLQNVFFTFGGLDPFRALGITENLNLWSPARVIPQFGKTFDLRRGLPGGVVTPGLLQVQAVIRAHIQIWIGV